jgi:phage terminase small subunit
MAGKKVQQAKEAQPLTDREEWVCREFVADAGENQTRAYMKVFKGCSYDSARTLAAKLFANVHIMNRINELRAERNKRLEITADKVLAGIAKLAFYDSRDFFDDNGKLKPLGELDPDHADVIAGIETFHKVTGDESDVVAITTKIKLADRGQNLERLGKHLKLFTDKTEITGKDGEALNIGVSFVKPTDG